MTGNRKTGDFEFKAEVRQLLDILVHSLYSNREIFLRELVSNASDALDKIRFETTRGAEVANPGLEPAISVAADKEARTLTVTDTGIGMTRDELVENIGTIAHSGTADFVRAASQEKDKTSLESIIGRFGVGFYSVFMVADRVELTTRPAAPGEPGWIWRSDGQGSYSIEEAPADTPRGTSIILHLKEDAEKYAEPETLRDVIRRHSGFISFPILVEGERVNTIAALWREPKFNVTQQQYAEFYKHLTHDTEDPLTTLHSSVDTPVQFSALLFAPPRNLDTMGLTDPNKGLDLYVRRVLIQRDCKDILPEYLGFLRGVVDSEDLPLNISRETLQENTLLRRIASTLTKQVLSHLEKLAKDDPETYTTFWNEFGRQFKFGYSDFPNRERFAGLVRFNSSTHEDEKGLTSLEEYVSRMGEGQKDIYYVSGSSRRAAQKSPHIDLLRRKGLEVLYLLDPVDEFVMDALGSFRDHPLTPAERADPEVLSGLEDVGTTEGEETAPELSGEEAEAFEGLLGRMKEILGDDVTEVRASRRLKDSPVCLVSPEGVSSGMQKIIRVMSKETAPPRQIFEVNRDHALVRNLLAVFRSRPGDDYVELATRQLFETALLQEGYLADPHGLIERIQDHLTRSSSWYSERVR